VNGTYVMNYGGYSFCKGQPAAAHNLTICAQVARDINGRIVWFTVTGSCLSKGTALGSVLLSTARTAFFGHAYRVPATTTVRYPTAHGTVTRTATAYSAGSGP
jgi:hypothetical protein